MSYGYDFVLTLFTNDPYLAKKADEAGVDRIGLDLEILNKEQRQAGLKTWISDHKEDDIPIIRDCLKSAKFFIRTNPPHEGLKDEVERYIRQGSDVLMLPMFRTVDDAAMFIDYVSGRAEVSLLVETAQAAIRLEEIVKLKGIKEIFIGLNDLHLSLGLKNHFELLCSRFMNMLSDIVNERGLQFGFGGIGRTEDTGLPIHPRYIYAQYPRLKARSALISRAFFNNVNIKDLDMSKEISKARELLNLFNSLPTDDLIDFQRTLCEGVKRWKK